MKPDQFCFWLQGLFELTDVTELDEKQTKCIKDHLKLVFVHSIDPELNKISSVPSEVLDHVHNGGRLFPMPDDKMRC